MFSLIDLFLKLCKAHIQLGLIIESNEHRKYINY